MTVQRGLTREPSGRGNKPKHYTDEVIKAALEEMDAAGTPSKAHSAFAVLMRMRDFYEDLLAQIEADKAVGKSVRNQDG